MYWLATAVIIKYHRMSVLNHRNLFLTVLEADKTKIKIKAVSVPPENSLPSLQTATTLSVSSQGESSGVSSRRAPDPLG